MICASDEIGLGELFPAEQEAEILDLSVFDVPAGTSLADALDMNDILLEIDNKSMTNRPDLWGHGSRVRSQHSMTCLSKRSNLLRQTFSPISGLKSKRRTDVQDTSALRCPA